MIGFHILCDGSQGGAACGFGTAAKNSPCCAEFFNMQLDFYREMMYDKMQRLYWIFSGNFRFPNSTALPFRVPCDYNVYRQPERWFLALPRKLLILLSLLLLVLTGCQGADKEMTTEEIQAQIQVAVDRIPSAEAGPVNLSQAATGYAAALDLTWKESVGRFSTERALKQYSQDLTASISRYAPEVSEVLLSWTVPYHSETEPTMVFSFKKSDDVLEQTELEDRFTDGTFGADAYVLPEETPEPAVSTKLPAKSPIGRTLSADALASTRIPHHKKVILPPTGEPRHKTLLQPKSFAPRHKTNPILPTDDIPAEAQKAAESDAAPAQDAPAS